jgi:tRNA 5-methylaminomethyl-2-thiouridine biosynthesis bifunctional protein
MKSEPIDPARIHFIDGAPFAPDFNDIYHSRAGAFAQARHVFLGGNRLPHRWQGRERFVILETGFGLGNNFLATWAAWRDDPQRCERLWFVSVEKHPPTRDDLARAHAHSPEPGLAAALVAAWPPLTFNLHPLTFEQGRVNLLLAFGDAGRSMRELVAGVDAFYLDGFAPARNPQMWSPTVFDALGRMANTGATAATWSAAHEVREGLAKAGFAVERATGFDAKRDMTVARYAPRHRPMRPPGRVAGTGARDAIVVGAGLAGAAAAHALAGQGIACHVIDAHAAPAQGASGNAGGLFHGTVHGDDGVHARFNRAAALVAARAYEPLIRAGVVPGQAAGVLRSESMLEAAGMQQRLQALGLPTDWVQAVDAATAATLCGLPLDRPAWHYPAGGWIDPAALIAHWLSDPRIEVTAGAPVDRLRRAGSRWQAVAHDGAVLAEADAMIVAAAHDTPRLVGDAAWPLSSVRGQLTRLPPGIVPAPSLPVAGDGYAIALPDGGVLCGATAQPDDAEPALRPEDQRFNLDRLARLVGHAVPDVPLSGRVGWRLATQDRLPLAGAMPAALPPDHGLDQPRRIPRAPGLFVLAALGSRGLTWAPLAAQVIAAAITGAPSPLEASLLDAIDPARFLARRVRRSAS